MTAPASTAHGRLPGRRSLPPVKSHSSPYEPTDDGWPDKYRDPRDRPHPDVLRITVESFEEMREGTHAAFEAVSEGEEQPAVVSFHTVSELRKALTDRRIELLRALLATEGAAESISA